ncbi:MAG: hypothetical protein ACKVOK_03800 [Flavobacteriales bacterium]
MKHLLICLISSIFLSSCAVLFNKDYTVVHIESEIPNTTAQVLPDTPVYNAPVTLGVLRSRSNLEIRFKNDSLDSVFQVKSRIDPWVWGNLYTYGFGMLIDLAHPRGRTYPAHIRLTKNGLETFTKRQWRKRSWYIQDRGLFVLNFDWTLMNTQTSYDGSSYLTMGAPMFNFGMGAECFLSPTRSIGVGVGFALGDIFERFGSTFYPRMNSFYYRASYQYDWRSFKLSAGLSLLQQYVENPSDEMVFDTHGSTLQIMNEVNPVAIGPCVGFEWRAGEFVSIGSQYMTGLYSFNTEPHWAYRDVVLAICFKMRIPFGVSRAKDPRPRSYKISELP